MTRSWDRMQPRLAEALRAGVPYPPELVLAHFPHEAPLLGAVALAVDAAAGQQPAKALAARTQAAPLDSQYWPRTQSQTTADGTSRPATLIQTRHYSTKRHHSTSPPKSRHRNIEGLGRT